MDAPPAPPPAAWSHPKRIAFRFGFLLAVMVMFPFPLGTLPWTDWLVGPLTRPWEWLVEWLATSVLGLDAPSNAPTGSGDTTWVFVWHLLALVLAIIGTAIWTALDRRRTAYPRLAAGAIVVLRYYLAFILLSYGFAKLTQFPPPDPYRLDQRVGDMSPMGMLWTFMGSSQPYSLFGGCAEALGGVLLLWRRASVAGALVAIAAMTNVVALNFFYDVPVKLFSTQLLVIAIVIVLPHARRLIAAVLGHATAEVPPRPRRSRRLERARLAAKVLLLVSFAYQLHEEVGMSLEYRTPAPHELHGVWVVEQFVLDGIARPPLTTDAERWHKVYLAKRRSGVRLMTDERVIFLATLDAEHHRIEVKLRTGEQEVWVYATSVEGDVTRLALDGAFRGKRFHARLRREPEPLLVTRGFRWINEVPFNR
jgi:hypothetical protein